MVLAAGPVTGHGPRRGPLALIAAPAAVAVWSGWVGLGGMCGFGVIHPLPGIADAFQLNTAITLPVGVEAYGAYALGAWLAPGGVPGTARTFARRSAIGALLLGMAGQVIYHLLAAAHATRAPWPVVVLVSCMPVVTLGFGAALTHLLRAVPGGVPEPGAVPERVPADPPAPAVTPDDGTGTGRLTAWLTSEPVTVPAVPEPPVTLNGHASAAAGMFAADLQAGRVPGIRAIKSGLHVSQDKATEVQAYLRTLTRT